MTDQAIAEAFARHDFLKGFSDHALKVLGSGAESFSCHAGDYIGKEGEPATKFYLVQAGHVRLQLYSPEHGSIIIQTVGDGDALGWSWLVWPFKWRFDCVAVDEVSGIAFDAAWLRQRCDEDFELGYQVAKRLLSVTASRLGATRVQLLDMFR